MVPPAPVPPPNPRQPWLADVHPSREAAAALLDEQFPELAPARLQLLGEGWDNTAWLVNDEHVVRFPRRQIAVELLETETRFLPQLAHRLPLAVPVPDRIGVPAGDYPYPFAGYRRLPGVTACAVGGLDCTDEVAMINGRRLGEFLRALHDAPVAEGAPPDRFGRAELAKRHQRLTELLARLVAAGTLADDVASRITDRLATLVSTAPHAGPAAWTHGDLYVRHLLVNEAGEVTGVIDWGDLHVGDPAIDLSIAFSALPPSARAAFFASYGRVDDAARGRARFRGICYGPLLIHYATDIADNALLTAGHRAIELALADDK